MHRGRDMKELIWGVLGQLLASSVSIAFILNDFELTHGYGNHCSTDQETEE